MTMTTHPFDSTEQEEIFWQVVRSYEYHMSRYQKHKAYIINRKISPERNKTFKSIINLANFIIEKELQEDISVYVAAQFEHLKGNDDKSKWNYPWLNKLRSERAYNKYLKYKERTNTTVVRDVWIDKLKQDYITIHYEFERNKTPQLKTQEDVVKYVKDTIIKLIYHPAIYISPYYLVAVPIMWDRLKDVYTHSKQLHPADPIYDYCKMLLEPLYFTTSNIVEDVPTTFYTRLIQERTKLDNQYNFIYGNIVVYYSFRSVKSGRTGGIVKNNGRCTRRNSEVVTK